MSSFSSPIIFPGAVQILGNLAPTTISQPANSISDTSVVTPAGGAAGIATGKQNHRQHVKYSQPNTTATSETRSIWITNGTAGAIQKFRAGSIAINAGAATVTIDLKKNGASVLSAVITLDSSATARTKVEATVTTPGSVAGDWYEIVIVATAGGGTLATGLFVELVIDETPS